MGRCLQSAVVSCCVLDWWGYPTWLLWQTLMKTFRSLSSTVLMTYLHGVQTPQNIGLHISSQHAIAYSQLAGCSWRISTHVLSCHGDQPCSKPEECISAVLRCAVSTHPGCGVTSWVACCASACWPLARFTFATSSCNRGDAEYARWSSLHVWLGTEAAYQSLLEQEQQQQQQWQARTCKSSGIGPSPLWPAS